MQWSKIKSIPAPRRGIAPSATSIVIVKPPTAWAVVACRSRYTTAAVEVETSGAGGQLHFADPVAATVCEDVIHVSSLGDTGTATTTNTFCPKIRSTSQSARHTYRYASVVDQQLHLITKDYLEDTDRCRSSRQFQLLGVCEYHPH